MAKGLIDQPVKRRSIKAAPRGETLKHVPILLGAQPHTLASVLFAEELNSSF